MKSGKTIVSHPNCSTWNILRGCILSFLFVFICACEQKDPKPELKDLIYQDMLGQQANADKISKDMDAKIEEILKATVDARPQTGMKQKADRQIHELKKTKEKMAQQMTYWKIRSFERLKMVRFKAAESKEPYKTDPREWELYQSEKKLRVAKNAWDLKDRFKETGFDYNPVLMGENPAEVAPKEKPKAPAGGGH
jgi:hypothetical protein